VNAIFIIRFLGFVIITAVIVFAVFLIKGVDSLEKEILVEIDNKNENTGKET